MDPGQQIPIARPVDPDGFSNKLGEGAASISNSLNEGYKNASSSISDTLNDFSSKTVSPDATPDFLQSNSIVAKFVFLIFVLIIFMILLSLGITFMGALLSPSGSPYLIKGTRNGTDNMTVFTDPSKSGSIPISRSNNQSTGMEFTWSVWLLITNVNVTGDNKEYNNVFNKGNSQYGSNGIATVNNAPGLYINNKAQSLHIVMDTVTGKPPITIDIKNIPIKKWFNVIIRLENTALDTYINGVIANRLVLQNTPKQNYEDVNICANGGFAGMLADLRYYNRALSIFDILSVVNYGRNTSMADSGDATNYPYYLSNSWYSN